MRPQNLDHLYARFIGAGGLTLNDNGSGRYSGQHQPFRLQGSLVETMTAAAGAYDHGRRAHFVQLQRCPRPLCSFGGKPLIIQLTMREQNNRVTGLRRTGLPQWAAIVVRQRRKRQQAYNNNRQHDDS
jgi:hypothetical protein